MAWAQIESCDSLIKLKPSIKAAETPIVVETSKRHNPYCRKPWRQKHQLNDPISLSSVRLAEFVRLTRVIATKSPEKSTPFPTSKFGPHSQLIEKGRRPE